MWFKVVLLGCCLFFVSCKNILGEDYKSAQFQNIHPIGRGVENRAEDEDTLKGDDLNDFKISFEEDSPDYVCHKLSLVALLEQKNWCEESQRSKRAPLDKILLRDVNPGHYKVILYFDHGAPIEERSFTHTRDLYISLKSIYKNKGRLKRYSVSFISEDYESFFKNHKKLNLFDLLKSRKRRDVFNFEELKKELDLARGGEVIVLRRNIGEGNGQELIAKRKFSSRVYFVGMLDNGDAPHLDQVRWRGFQKLTVAHLKVNRKNIKISSHGFSTDYAWRVKDCQGFSMRGLHFFGSDDGLSELKKNSLKGVFNDPRGVYIKDSKEVIIEESLFENLYHAVEFQNVDGLYALSNKANKITSDMFSGGGLRNGLFDSNLSLTKTPVLYTYKGQQLYTHSDVIQLYTTSQKVANENITIRNNIALAGDSPVNNKLSAGWQCFFTRDETGDTGKALLYRKIRIYNNLCVSNQHHGITLGRGADNYVASNLILELHEAKESITAAIRINENISTKVFNNISKRLFLKEPVDLVLKQNRELDRRNQWVTSFYQRHIENNRLRVPVRGLASLAEDFGEVFNLQELGAVPFD